MADGCIRAPAGWGHLPGALLACDVRASLPDMPLLSRVTPGQRTQVIAAAIRSAPGLAELVTPADIAHKYGVHRGIARNALLIAQRGCGACCSLVIDGELVACRHLIAGAGTYRCAIYDTRPQVCGDYDCTREPSNPLVADRARAAMEAV